MRRGVCQHGARESAPAPRGRARRRVLRGAAAARPAGAFTAAEGRAAADRAAIAWARDHQQRDGAFVDYVVAAADLRLRRVMIGYGLLRAGVRRHDDA